MKLKYSLALAAAAVLVAEDADSANNMQMPVMGAQSTGFQEAVWSAPRPYDLVMPAPASRASRHHITLPILGIAAALLLLLVHHQKHKAGVSNIICYSTAHLVGGLSTGA